MKFETECQKSIKENDTENIVCGMATILSRSDSDSDRGLFNIKLHTKVLHQVYIAKQYEHIEQI